MLLIAPPVTAIPLTLPVVILLACIVNCQSFHIFSRTRSNCNSVDDSTNDEINPLIVFEKILSFPVAVVIP
jgi:hypothetical protein